MSTSTFNLTFDKLVRRALRKLGNTNPSNDDLTNARESLNVIVKNVDPDGRWLWTISNTETVLNIVANQNSYTTAAVPPTGIPSDMLALNAFFLMIGTYHVPMRILAKTESTTSWDRDFTGQPFEVFLEKQPLSANNTLWVYPTPNAAWTAKFTYKRHLYDFINPNDVADFPQNWLQALTYLLAAELTDDYGTPDPVATRINAKAEGYLKKAKAANGAENPTPTPVHIHYF